MLLATSPASDLQLPANQGTVVSLTRATEPLSAPAESCQNCTPKASQTPPGLSPWPLASLFSLVTTQSTSHSGQQPCPGPTLPKRPWLPKALFWASFSCASTSPSPAASSQLQGYGFQELVDHKCASQGGMASLSFVSFYAIACSASRFASFRGP